LMRRFAVGILEKPDKMKFREKRFISNIIQINVFEIILIDKELCLYDSAI
jgi:hypothetical protein